MDIVASLKGWCVRVWVVCTWFCTSLGEHVPRRFVVMKADQERKAAIIRAEGESESARLISEATRAVCEPRP